MWHSCSCVRYAASLPAMLLNCKLLAHRDTLYPLLHPRAISPHYIQATRRRFVTHHGKLPWIRELCITHVATAAAVAAVVQVVLMALVATFGGSSSPPTGWPTAIFLIPPAAFIRCVGLITSRGGSTINPGTVQSRYCCSSMMAPLTPLACWRADGRIRAGIRPWLHGPCWDAASSAWHVCVCVTLCVCMDVMARLWLTPTKYCTLS